MEGADNAAACVDSLFTLSELPGPKNFSANLTVDNIGLEVFGRLDQGSKATHTPRLNAIKGPSSDRYSNIKV